MKISRIVEAYALGHVHFSEGQKQAIQEPAHDVDMDGAPWSRFQDSKEPFVEVHTGEMTLQVSVAEILVKLPEHIMAYVMLWEEGTMLPMTLGSLVFSPMEYICHLVRLFVSLCPTFRLMKDSMDLFDAEYQMRLVDSMTLILLVISSVAGKCRLLEALEETSDTVLLRDAAALVDIAPSCLQAALLFFTERDRGVRNRYSTTDGKLVEFDQEFELCCILSGLKLHPRGWVFLQAAIEATRVTVQTLVRKLQTDIYTNLINSAAMARSAEYSMKVLEQLFAEEAFYSWYIQHDVNASAIARLLCSCLDLVTNGLSAPPFFCVLDSRKYTYEPRQRQACGRFYPTDPCDGFAEFIVARACAMIVSLEYQSPSFCDRIHEADEESKCLAQAMVDGVVNLLKQVLRRPSIDSHTMSRGEGQLAINCLRAADKLTDHATFKNDIRKSIQGEISLLLSSMTPKDFKSFWGPGCLSIRYMIYDEDYPIQSTSKTFRLHQSMYGNMIQGDDNNLFFDSLHAQDKWLAGLDARSTNGGLELGLERAVLLIKLIGKLQIENKNCDSRFVGHLVFMQNGAHDYLRKNLTYLCSLAVKCVKDDCDQPLSRAEVILLKEVLNEIKKHTSVMS